MRKILLAGFLLLAACSHGDGKHNQDSLTGYDRPPRDYPQTGYVLGDNGKYIFKPLTMSNR